MVRKVVSIFTFFVIASCYYTNSLVADGSVVDFTLKTLDNKEFRLKEVNANAIILDFWATWCFPCKAQTEILKDIYRDYSNKGVKIISINVGETQEKVKKYVEKNSIPFVQLLDSDQKVSDALQITALPTIIVLDKNKKIVFKNSTLTKRKKIILHLKKLGIN